MPGDILFVLSLVAGTRDVSSFQPFFIVGHFAVVLPIAFGRGKCEAGDGSAPDSGEVSSESLYLIIKRKQNIIITHL